MDNEKKFDSYLISLQGINKEELNEREFYEQVLGVIKDMKDVSLTPETAKQLKNVLTEIGCMRRDEWKAEKEKNGEKIEKNTIEKGIEQADISTAVAFVSELLGDYNYVNLSLERMLDGGEEYGWVQEWLKNSQKLNSPYYKVAQQALMNWNKLSEKEAKEIISTQSFDEIEEKVDAKASMNYAAEGIMKYYSEKLNLPVFDKDREELINFIYNGGKSSIIYDLKQEADFVNGEKGRKYPKTKKMINDMIMDTLFHVHDGWVKDKVGKFNAREKKHQHMPSELIGWKEAKSDLLFVKPIFEAAGIEVNEEELEQVYNERVKDFFLDRKIKTSRDLSDLITQGAEFYPALGGYGEILTAINDPDYVDQRIIPAIEQQGIGKVEDVRQNIVSQIINNPTAEDIDRLSDDEKKQVEETLGQEVNTLTAQRDELRQKNSIVQSIMLLAKQRNDLNRKIAEEEKRKSDNIHSLDD